MLWYLWVKHARTRIAVVVANKACLYAKEGNPSCLTMHLSKEKISKNSYVKHRFHKCEYANTDGHQYLCYFSLTNYCTLDFETKTSIWEWLSCKNLERNNLVHEKLKSAIFGYILYVFHYMWHCFFLFLGVTTVLTMTFLGLEARTDLPQVAYPTALDYFVFFSFMFIFSTVVQVIWNL